MGLACLLAAALPAATGPAPDAPLVPAGPEARSYAPATATKGGPPRDPLRDAILADARAVARQAGRPAPAHDARLDWAMTDLARHLGPSEIPSIEVTAFVLAHYGLPEPSPHFFLARLTPGAEAEVRARARAELAVALRAGPVGRIGVGIDRSGPEVRVVAGFQETPIALASGIPRRLQAGARLRIEARIVGAYHEPELVVTAPDGSTHEERTIQPPGLAVEFVCALDGALPAGDRRHRRGRADGAGELSALIAAFRPRRALPGRRGDAPGPRRSESRGAADRRAGQPRPRAGRRRPGHRRRASCRRRARALPGHGRPRLRGARLAAHRERRRSRRTAPGSLAEILFENVGRAYSPDSAESGFLGSPGHRGNLLDPRARRIGVGVVFGPEVERDRARSSSPSSSRARSSHG